MCSHVWFCVQWTHNITHRQLFEFHLRFGAAFYICILSENIYLSHIGPSIHELCERLRARECVCVCMYPQNNCKGCVNYFVGVWQPNCWWLSHTHKRTRDVLDWNSVKWMYESTKFDAAKWNGWMGIGTWYARKRKNESSEKIKKNRHTESVIIEWSHLIELLQKFIK